MFEDFLLSLYSYEIRTVRLMFWLAVLNQMVLTFYKVSGNDCIWRHIKYSFLEPTIKVLCYAYEHSIKVTKLYICLHEIWFSLILLRKLISYQGCFYFRVEAFLFFNSNKTTAYKFLTAICHLARSYKKERISN